MFVLEINFNLQVPSTRAIQFSIPPNNPLIFLISKPSNCAADREIKFICEPLSIKINPFKLPKESGEFIMAMARRTFVYDGVNT